MASLNFPPATPGVPGNTYTENGVVYYWDGEKWTANNEDGFTDVFVNVDGDNMTGNLTLGTDKITLDATDGHAEFAGNNKIGSFDPSEDTANGLQFNKNGRIYLQRTSGTSDDTTAFSVQKGSKDPTIEFTAGGSAKFAGDVQMASQNGGPLAGFRNQLINASFEINQRGNDDLTTSAAGSNYLVDRYWFQRQGSEARLRRISSTAVPGSNYALFLTDSGTLNQAVELKTPGLNNQFYVGSVWTLSVWCNQDISGQTFGSGGFRISSNDANGSVPLESTPSAWRLIETGSSSYNRYAKTITVDGVAPATATCASFGLINHAATGNAAIQLPQLETGPVATPFEHRPIGTELALCKRYFDIIESKVNGVRLGIGESTSPDNIRFNLQQFCPFLRRINLPSIRFGGSIQVMIGNVGTTITGVQIQDNQFTLQVGSDIFGAAGVIKGVRMQNGAFVSFDCEL